MIRRILPVLIAVMLLGVTVSAKGLMEKVDRPVTPNPDQAVIVFMRSSSIGQAISASVFDVTGAETKFIGIMYNGTKVCYDVAPGEYTFMVIGESADFMKATVTAGKTYYALITPRMGVWKARFSFKPLRKMDLEGADFSKWDSRTYVVENTPEAEKWAQDNASDVESKRSKNWPEWTQLSPEQQDSMTLKEDDGR